MASKDRLRQKPTKRALTPEQKAKYVKMHAEASRLSVRASQARRVLIPFAVGIAFILGAFTATDADPKGRIIMAVIGIGCVGFASWYLVASVRKNRISDAKL